jgi:PAS domain S-box-containing protein
MSLISHAQVYEFQQINQEQGLPSSVITALEQDSRGLIWIGTDGGGLVKSDGLSFKIYDASNELKGTSITDIIEDDNLNLIVASKFNGISVFNGDKFFKTYDILTKTLKSNYIYKLVKSTKGIYCIGDKEIVLLKRDYSVENIIYHNNTFGEVSSAEIDNNGNLLIGGSKGLFVLNKTIISLLPELFNGHTSICKNNLSEIIAISEKGGIYKINQSNLNYSAIQIMATPLNFKPKYIFVSKENNLWISGDQQQDLLMYNGKSIEKFNKNNGFIGDNILCFMQDRSGNMYFGTQGFGLLKTGKQLFISYINVEELNKPSIFSILKDKSDVYVGMNKKGLLKFSENNLGQLTFQKTYANVSKGASVIFKNNANEIIFGSKKGIQIIKNDKLVDISLPYFTDETKAIVAIFQDKKNRYFFGSYGGGLLITDEKFNFITKIPEKINELDDYVYTINQFEPNKWYIGSNHGLFILTEESPNVFKKSDAKIVSPFSISTKDCFGNYWFAGLDYIFSYGKNGKKEFNKKNGLTSTVIYTLIADKFGNIWAGSNLGLDKISVNDKGEIVSVKNYNSKNGFKGLETNTRAQFIDNEGNIYLGTGIGIVKCLTASKIDNEIPRQVVITDLKVLNKNIDWTTEASKDKWNNIPDSGFIFNTEDNQLTFRFSCINSEINDKLYFAFKLEGADADWSNPNLLNEITYSNLRSGDYVFKVKLVDVTGKDLSQETRLSFSIKTPFYLSWWFITSVFVLLALVIYFLFNKFSTFNPDYVKEANNSLEEDNKANRMFLLFFGTFTPLVEFFFEIFHLRVHSELYFNFSIGFFCIVSYYLSFKSKFVYKYLSVAVVILFLAYFVSHAIKIWVLPFELITFASHCLVLFFSFSVFKNIKHYWIYVGFLVLFSFALFFNSSMDFNIAIVYAFVTLFVTKLNHARYIIRLNNTEKLLFTNNIVNNGSSLVLGTDKMGKVIYCSENISKILGYTSEEVKGMAFWTLTQDKEYAFSDYSEKYVKDRVYIRKLKCKNGDYKHIQWTDSKHSNDLFVGIGQDVTEQVKAREQYKNLVQNAPDIIFEADGSGYFTFINEAMQRILGFSSEELLGQHFTSIVSINSKLQVVKFYSELSTNQNDFDVLEFPVTSKNKKEFWVSQKVIVYRNEVGEIISFSAITRDITTIKNIELEKVKRQEKMNTYNQVLHQLTTNPNTADSNLDEIVRDILLKSSEALKIDRISIWNHFDDKVVSLKAYSANSNTFDQGEVILGKDYPKYFSALTEGKTIIANNICEHDYTSDFCLSPDNDIKSLLDVPMFLNGKLSGLVCCEMTTSFRVWDNEDLNFARSVAEIISISLETEKRKSAELAIKESESNFRMLNETIDDVFWLYDLKSKKLLYVSPSSEKIFGVKPIEYYSQFDYWKNYILESDQSIIYNAHKNLALNGFYEIEYRIKVNNSIKWIHEKSFGIKDVNGFYFKSSGICSDITEKKKIELELKQLSIVAEKTTNGILVADQLGRVIWANQGYLDMVEISLGDLIGNRPRDLFNPNGEDFKNEIDVLNGTNFSKEIEIITTSKKIKWVELTNTVIKDDNGNVVQQIEVVTEITEKVKNRNVLLQLSSDLEYKNTLQQNIINSQSYEELAFKTLSFIKSQTKGCVSVALAKVNDKNDHFSGYEIVDNQFNKLVIPMSTTRSTSTLQKGEIFIERNLKTAKEVSVSDLDNRHINVISYILLPIMDGDRLIAGIHVSLGRVFDLTDNEIKNLESITLLLSVAIKQLDLKNELLQINKDNIDSLNYAQNIQRTILPEITKLTKTFNDISLYFKPRNIVSGDFYWAKEKNGLTFIAVADCTGHGVPGAFLTLIGSRILEQIVDIEKITNPAEILMKLDDQIYLSLNNKEHDIIRDGMEIGLCVIDTKANKLSFAGAGLGLLYFIDGQEFYIKGQRKSIGDYRDDDFKFKTIEINVTGDECFYMATDGYQDQLGGNHYKRFSKKRTIDLLKSIIPKSGIEKEQILSKEMDEFIGIHQQTDDITVVSFSIIPHKKVID